MFTDPNKTEMNESVYSQYFYHNASYVSLIPEKELLSWSAGRHHLLYKLQNKRLLMHALDYVSLNGVPTKNEMEGLGELLIMCTKFWYDKLSSVTPNQCVVYDNISDILPNLSSEQMDRCMLVRDSAVLPIDVEIYNWMYGHAWDLYRQEKITQHIPINLKLGSHLDHPIILYKSNRWSDQFKYYPETTFARMIRPTNATKLIDLCLVINNIIKKYCLSKDLMLAQYTLRFAQGLNGPLLAGFVLNPVETVIWDMDMVRQKQPISKLSSPLAQWMHDALKANKEITFDTELESSMLTEEMDFISKIYQKMLG